MKKRKTGRMLWRAFRTSGAGKIYLIFLIYFVIVAVILQFVEPNIKSFPDSLWYCFAVSSTIGFGDLTVHSFISKIISVALSIYAAGVIAIMTAVVVNYFNHLVELRRKESLTALIEKLKVLPELPKEELEELSERFKKLV